MVARAAQIILPVQTPNHPFLVTIVCKPDKPKVTFSFGAAWFNADGKMATERWITPQTTRRATNTFQIYFSNRYSLMIVNNGIATLSSYSAPYPSQKIGITLCNAHVKSINIQEVRPEDLPKVLQHPKQAINTFNQSKEWRYLPRGKLDRIWFSRHLLKKP